MNITKVEQKKLVWSKFFYSLRKFFDLLVLTTVFTSLVGAAIISFSFYLFSDKILPDMVICTSLITYSIYSLNRLTDIEEDSSNLPERTRFVQKRKNILLFLSIASYITALIIGGIRNLYTIPVFLIPFLVGILYSIKIFSIRVKDIFCMKNFAVSFTWASSSSLLPYIFFYEKTTAIMLFLFLFIKCFVNTVVFDVRDIEGDRKAGTKTIPVVIGIRKTMILLLLINSLLIILAVVCFLTNTFVKYLPVIIFSILYGYWYIVSFCKRSHGKFGFDYLVDGEFIILALLAAFINLLIS